MADINANEVKREPQHNGHSPVPFDDNDGALKLKKPERSEAHQNALRRLENLSQSHLSELLQQRQNLLAAAGASPQYPDLRMMMDNAPLSPARSHASSLEENEIENYQEDSEESLPVYDPYENSENGTGPQATSTTSNSISDKDQPIKCGACRKVFHNHFGVKTHYENAHLKLLHKCNIDGCNAAFPSKRSRDRHSSNLNLHRKLLSTSNDQQQQQHHHNRMDEGESKPLSSSAYSNPMASNPLQSELLARLYAESQGVPLNLEALKQLPAPFAEHLLNAAAAAMHRTKLSEEQHQIHRHHHENQMRYNAAAAAAAANPLLFPGLSPFASHLLPHHLNGFVNNNSRHLQRPPSNGSNSPISASSPPTNNNNRTTTTPSMPSPVNHRSRKSMADHHHNDQEEKRLRRPSTDSTNGPMDLQQPQNLQFQQRTQPESMS